MAQSPFVRTAARLVPLFSGALLLAATAAPASAQEAGYGQTLGAPQNRDLFDGDLGGDEETLDLNNPLDMINRLRRSSAMDDATPPGDAVDAALREFESRSAPPASPAPGASLTGP